MQAIRMQTLRMALALLGIAIVTSSCFVVVDPGHGRRHHQYREYNRP